MECSRDNCRRRMLCYGARAIKERGGSSYDQWYCYQPKVNKEEAAIVTANKTQKKESIPNERDKPRLQVKISFAHQPHGPHWNKCHCHAN